MFPSCNELCFDNMAHKHCTNKLQLPRFGLPGLEMERETASSSAPKVCSGRWENCYFPGNNQHLLWHWDTRKNSNQISNKQG